MALIIVGVVIIVVASFILKGLTIVARDARTSYNSSATTRGPSAQPGMQWVNAFADRIPVSTRIRNLESAQAKVNDANGNPIEIAAVIVWQVQDTAKATYSVDDYAELIAIQAETAVRHIASSYPYDSADPDTMSLRGNADEITSKLSAGSPTGWRRPA